MGKFLVLISAVLICLNTHSLKAQQIEVIKFSDLQQLMEKQKVEYSVFNFWATWCKPCIAELPYFEELGDKYDSKLKVYLISFDFVEDLETKVAAFVQKRNLKSDVKLLDETDYNSFIDRISPEWSGAIPATLFVNNKSGQSKFYEGEFSRNELMKEFKNFLN